MQPKTKFNIWYVLLALWGVFIFHHLFVQAFHVEQLPYSEFKKRLESGDVEQVSIRENILTGSFKEGEKSKFVTVRVESDIAEVLAKHGVKFSGVIESTFLRDLLSWVLPVLIFFAIWYIVMRRMANNQGLGGTLLSLGKSKAKVYMEQETKVTFDDVAGIDEVEDELKEIVNFLKEPERYRRLGGRLPRGVLLVGPPGTGKTLIAKAVAGEAKVPFFSINGSEFVEMFVGVGAARVRDLFEQARQHSPCIIFIDELDALGKARGNMAVGGHDEKEQTLNQLLVELDGFDGKSGIMLLAATNRPEVLDPALLRAGRFDRQIVVDKPDKKGRMEILSVHLKKVKTDSSVSAESVASITTGFSGADLANLVNEAALLATRRNARLVSHEDFVSAIERIIAGLEKKNRVLSPREREIVAYHEAGHALVSLLTPTSDPIVKVSIIPRGLGALGYLMQQPLEDRYLLSQEELEDRLKVLFGGRAAEAAIFSSVSTGATNDLSRATELARFMVTRYGMGTTTGLVCYDERQGVFLQGKGDPALMRNFSEHTAKAIDEEVASILSRNYSAALKLIKENQVKLESLAQALLEKETLNLEEIQQILCCINDVEKKVA